MTMLTGMRLGPPCLRERHGAAAGKRVPARQARLPIALPLALAHAGRARTERQATSVGAPEGARHFTANSACWPLALGPEVRAAARDHGGSGVAAHRTQPYSSSEGSGSTPPPSPKPGP